MARPKDDPKQFLAAYDLYKLGVTKAPAIAARLEVIFGESAKAERTIRDWIPQFKKAIENTSDVDAVFRWHLIDEQGLGWADSSTLLRFWRTFQQQAIAAFAVSIRLPEPTVRRVRWWVRVARAAPDLPDVDVMAIAAAYERRELRRDLLAVPFECDDLDAFLALRPWDAESAYQDSIRLGLVDPIRPDSSERVNHLAGEMTTIITTLSSALEQSLEISPDDTLREVMNAMTEFSRRKGQQGLAFNLGGLKWPDDEHDPPWLLPSSRYEEANLETEGSNE